jgi:hypothetical protein
MRQQRQGPAAAYRGYTLQLNQENQSFVASNLQTIYLQSLPIYSVGAGATTVKIYDLDTETEVFSSAATFAAGWNIVTVNTTFSYRRLYVCYDATAITSVGQDIEKLKQAVLYNGEGFGYYYLSYPYATGNIEIKGATSTIADKFNITYGSDTFGASGLFSVLCSFDGLICNNLSVFETAFWYLLGSELMFETSIQRQIKFIHYA